MDIRIGKSWSRRLMPVALLLAVAGCARELPPDISANKDVADNIRTTFNAAVGGDGAAGPSLPEPVGYGTLRGVFKVDGPVRDPVPLPVSGDDASYCTQEGQIYDQRVVIGPGNGLKNVVIFLNMKIPPDDEKWVHPDYQETAEAVLDGPQAFDQERCEFLTHVYAMRSTQTLIIKNSDPVGHNTNIAGTGRAGSQNNSLAAGQTDQYTPGGESSKPFPVTCAIHPWMKAWLLVRDNPYFAVTDEEGRFEIRNVPAGVELEFRVWQEEADYLSDVTVDASTDGQPVPNLQGETRWSKGRFKLALEDQKATEMNVVIPADLLQ